MIALREITDAIVHFLFPHICPGCGTDLLNVSTAICMRCRASMPETCFEYYQSNPVEKIFWGRLPLLGASAQYYFTKDSLMQKLMHQLKYRGNRDLGVQLGRTMGDQLIKSGRFAVDALIPLPLFPAKERKRGYNQATLICEGMAEVMNIPVLHQTVARPHFTETQTKKGRIERWKNIDGKFVLNDPASVQNKHVMLVDDVITTGATLEACGNELLRADNVQLSIATLCITSQ